VKLIFLRKLVLGDDHIITPQVDTLIRCAFALLLALFGSLLRVFTTLDHPIFSFLLQSGYLFTLGY